MCGDIEYECHLDKKICECEKNFIFDLCLLGKIKKMSVLASLLISSWLIAIICHFYVRILLGGVVGFFLLFYSCEADKVNSFTFAWIDILLMKDLGHLRVHLDYFFCGFLSILDIYLKKMLPYIVALLLIFLTYGYYRLIHRPQKLMKWYAVQFEGLGYRVHMIPYKLIGSATFDRYKESYSKYGDLYHF